jgi:hypothetical protein
MAIKIFAVKEQALEAALEEVFSASSLENIIKRIKWDRMATLLESCTNEDLDWILEEFKQRNLEK